MILSSLDLSSSVILREVSGEFPGALISVAGSGPHEKEDYGADHTYAEEGDEHRSPAQVIRDKADAQGGEGRTDVSEYAGKTVCGGGSLLGSLVGGADAYQGLRAVDSESGESQHDGGEHDGHLYQGEESEEDDGSYHREEAHAVCAALEDGIGSPSGEDGAEYGS